MLLEICACNYQSVLNAESAGAHRIELCSELATGGLTPSFGLLNHTINNSKIPGFVLIRPRSGNFTYSEAEFEIMKHDIEICKELGFAGIVSGVLNQDNTIDFERNKQLIALSKPLAFTFHRAFDWIPNPFESLEQLINLGVDRILTSGHAISAEKGIDFLKQLKSRAKDRITILPGGGIKAQNAKLFKDNGFTEIHASATSTIRVNEHPKVEMNSPKFFDETIEVVSDSEKIKGILSSINF